MHLFRLEMLNVHVFVSCPTTKPLCQVLIDHVDHTIVWGEVPS